MYMRCMHIKTDKDHTGSRTEKTKNQFMVGTEYYVYKQGSIKVKTIC